MGKVRASGRGSAVGVGLREDCRGPSLPNRVGDGAPRRGGPGAGVQACAHLTSVSNHLPPFCSFKQGNFFQNIGSITLFAVFGTAISAFVVGGGIYFLGQVRKTSLNNF